MRVPAPARYAAARIIWWEFFSERLIPVRWGHLDVLLKNRTEVSDPALVAALVAVGAPREWAERRVVVKPRRRKKIGGKWT